MSVPTQESRLEDCEREIFSIREEMKMLRKELHEYLEDKINKKKMAEKVKIRKQKKKAQKL